MTAIVVPYGQDAAGRMVSVADVARGKDCGLHCPSCRSPLVARKGERKRHHLAHMAGNPVCEGWLHHTAKMLLAQRIADAIASGGAVPIQWECSCPGPFTKSATHNRNLLGKGVLDDVRTEYRIRELSIQPDIVCLGRGAPKVIVEIVDTHPPEQPVIESGLPILVVNVRETADLDALIDGAVPVAVMHNYPCPDPFCDKCGRRRSEGCYRCLDCGKHCAESDHKHVWCDECGWLIMPGWWGQHRHRYCEECDAVVAETEIFMDGSGCGGWNHLHCAGCRKLISWQTRACGCAYTHCKPCWRTL